MKKVILNTDNSFKYTGNELEFFKDASNWKSYWSSRIAIYIYGNVLEVGCGLFQNIKYLNNKKVTQWVGLEPDSSLVNSIDARTANKEFPNSKLVLGNINTVNQNNFNVILYIDVLEHIKDDKYELINAVSKLSINGNLVILAPAYPFLYSRLDEDVGHFRRYTASSLMSIVPENCVVKKIFYLDSLGLILNLLNKYIIKKTMPTKRQIYFWDRVVIRISKIIDILVFYKFGRSVVLVITRKM